MKNAPSQSNSRSQNLKPLPTYSQLSMSNALLSNQSYQEQSSKQKRVQTPPKILNFQMSATDIPNNGSKVPYQMNQPNYGISPTTNNSVSFSSHHNLSNHNNLSQDLSESTMIQPPPYSLINTYEPNKRHLEYLKYDNNWIIGNTMEKRVTSTTPPSSSIPNMLPNEPVSSPYNYTNYLSPNTNSSPYYSPITTPIRNNFNLYSLLDPQNKRVTQPYQQQLLNHVLSPTDNQNQKVFNNSTNNNNNSNATSNSLLKNTPGNFQIRSKSLDADKFLNLDNGNFLNIFVMNLYSLI